MTKKILWAGLLLFHVAVWLHAQTKADSVAIVSAQWETSSPREGITLKCAAIDHLYNGPQYISIVEVEPRKELCAGIALSDKPAPTSVVAQAYNAVAAVNGSYFSIKKGNSVCFLQIDGVVKDTTTTAELDMRVNGAVQTDKGRLKILPWSKDIENYHCAKDVLASGPMLLQQGKASNWEACDSLFIHTQHPRSAVAVKKDGTTWFVTVDGRAPGHANGMSIPELAHLLRILGGYDALNLDGGGSTTLWLEGNVINHPSDNKQFDHAGERAVPTILYFGLQPD
ncbi:MAG TPA: phosphodiester glycosidase family protein [Candidatus Bacteroides merdigallinarum]|uniref:Phosphodiester glycosidase family protein n=1 Tax=Candidatus Bacteroides merdigallinarum TaxID=2838473 RepID=A0A9D2EAD9_9BACE|nr:phosphodiester glycosidase family protein [Candidatus Bacteroides merdigallinarum]